MERPRPFQIRSRSTFSVTRYPFIPAVPNQPWKSGQDVGDHGSTLSPEHPLKTPEKTENTAKPRSNHDYEEGDGDDDGESFGQGDTGVLRGKSPVWKESSDNVNTRKIETKGTIITSSSGTPPKSLSPVDESLDKQSSKSVTDSVGDSPQINVTLSTLESKGQHKQWEEGGDGRHLTYDEMEAKLKTHIMERFARQKKLDLRTLGVKNQRDLMTLLETGARKGGLQESRERDTYKRDVHTEGYGGARSIHTATSAVTTSVTSFQSSEWPFVTPPPQKKVLKPVLANFGRIEYFQAPFRRLPTPWLSRPETPLQKIYGSVVKQMPFDTERERKKLIDQAVTNGHMYRKIKKAQSDYSRGEQLRHFKKHEAFVRFKGPVANPESFRIKRNKPAMQCCYSFKPYTQENIDPDLGDLNSIFDDDSPVPTANQ